MIYLVELTGYTDAAVSAVYRFATADYTTARADTPADTLYEGRVLGIGSISRSMFRPGESGVRANPRSEVGVGVITLANVDGGLDALFDGTVSFRERAVSVYSVEPGAAYSSKVLRLRAVISQAALRLDTVEVSIKDRLYELSSPHSTQAYGGTNVLPAGVDGGPELAAKPKPQVFGKVFGVGPVAVNTSRLIYQISARALQSVQAVYDGGSALTAGAAYADQADMEAVPPTPGQYRAWLAGGMIRLASTPTYRITVDCTADSSGGSTAAQLIKTLALARGISSGDISAADVAALDTANNAVCGVLLRGNESTLDLMDELANSVGAWYGFDRGGTLRMARYGLPAGTAGDGSLPVVARWNARSLEQVPNGEDVPTQTVRVRYARHWQPIGSGEFAGAVSAADRADLSQEWRTAEYSAAPSPNPYARPLTVERDTALTTQAAALAEATRLHALTAASRRTHRALGVAGVNADIAAEVELHWDRYGLGDVIGTPRLVIEMTEDLLAQTADLTLWGP